VYLLCYAYFDWILETEIVTLLPLDGSFIRLAGRMVDPALGVAVGWNHFVSRAGPIFTF
jgi:amino acid permease